jgi:2-oxopent-4-enoate/cis-2-oxohex-4-enoate hydratase
VADTSLLLQPRIEGEIAFVLGRDLLGPGLTAADVLRATDFLLPALEIIDSRIADWKITYPDTIADNASSGLFVTGSVPVSARGVDLELCGMALRKNGVVSSVGVGAACLDHPVNAVVWLANKLGELEEPLRAGSVVLSGALGPVLPVAKGDAFELEIAHVGRCSVRFG